MDFVCAAVGGDVRVGGGVQSFEPLPPAFANLMQQILCACLYVHHTCLAIVHRGVSETVKLQGPSQVKICQYATVWPNSFVVYCFSMLFPRCAGGERPAGRRCNSPGTTLLLLLAPSWQQLLRMR